MCVLPATSNCHVDRHLDCHVIVTYLSRNCHVRVLLGHPCLPGASCGFLGMSFSSQNRLDTQIHTKLWRSAWARCICSGLWGHPGGAWEKQERHKGVRNRILIDLGRLWDLVLKTFQSLRLDISISFGLVPRLLFVLILESKFVCLRLIKRGFRMERIAKRTFRASRV